MGIYNTIAASTPGLSNMSLIFIGIVFILAVVIFGISRSSKGQDKTEEASPPQVSVPDAAPPKASGGLVLDNVSDRDAAMIMAIVADKTQTPLNMLRFRSIKRI